MIEIFPGRSIIVDEETTIEDWWGRDEEGTWCAYARFVNYPYYLLLCDIEVRTGWRKRGLAKELIARIRHHYDKIVFSTGKYTEQGFNALGALLPEAPGSKPARIEYTTPMTFVKGWDNQSTHHPI